ncbi:MAG: antibiotic biosynthesis monooxygenase [Thermomicrobiales bacterium]
MIVARQVFQAKYGRGDELVALFKEFNERMRREESGFSGFRILTDASGPFFTVVTEVEVASFADWEGKFGESMSKPWMEEWFRKMVELVDSGSREFFHVAE